MWRGFVNLVMHFFLGFIKLTKEKLNLPWDCISPNTPPPLPTFDVETGYFPRNNTTIDGQSSNQLPHYHPPANVKWSLKSLIGVCVALVGITVQALQTSELLNSPSFHWICMALVFSLTATLLSIYTAGYYERVSLLVVHAGIFIVFTALVVAIVINIQLPLKLISVAVYMIGILVVILAKLRKPKL